MDSKSKKKSKNPPEQKRDNNKSQEETQGSRKNKGEMSKYAYCSKGYNPERSYMKKRIDMLTQILEKNNISLPKFSKKKEGGSNSEDKERVHVLVVGTSSSPRFIIDSGASRHMVLTKEAFSSLDMLLHPNPVTTM